MAGKLTDYEQARQAVRDRLTDEALEDIPVPKDLRKLSEGKAAARHSRGRVPTGRRRTE